MKNLIFILVLGCINYGSFAQTTQVKFGRHGACSTGRGICGIQTTANAKTNTNNATFIKDANGNVIIRLYKVKLSQPQIEMLFGKHIDPDSTSEILQIEHEFELDPKTKTSLYNATGLNINLVNAAMLEAQISQDFIDVVLIKSKS